MIKIYGFFSVFFLSGIVLFYAHASFSQAPVCIFIEGLVGSGKTTFARLVSEHVPEVKIMFEPLEKWLDVHGHGSLYDLFLKDTSRWAFSTEVYIPFARMKVLEETLQISPYPMTMIDRSMYADRYVFAKTVFALGSMNLMEWAMYQEWFAWFEKNVSVKPSGFIYLQATPETTLLRIQQRDRIEEKDYPLQLQEAFYQCYQDWFMHKKDIPVELAQVPGLIIDADENFKDDPVIQQKCIDQVRAFIAQLMVF